MLSINYRKPLSYIIWFAVYINSLTLTNILSIFLSCWVQSQMFIYYCNLCLQFNYKQTWKTKNLVIIRFTAGERKLTLYLHFSPVPQSSPFQRSIWLIIFLLVSGQSRPKFLRKTYNLKNELTQLVLNIKAK